MTTTKLDPRIITALETLANTDCRYVSIDVRFENGEQNLSSLYAVPEQGSGVHLMDVGKRYSLDEVLELAQGVQNESVETAEKGKIKLELDKLKREGKENKRKIETLNIRLEKLTEQG